MRRGRRGRREDGFKVVGRDGAGGYFIGQGKADGAGGEAVGWWASQGEDKR